MQRIAVLSLAMLVCLAAVAQANPAAWFGPNNTYNPSVYTYNVTTAGGSLDAQIWVANDPSTDDANYLTNNGLPGIDLYVQMGAGGFAQDGSDPGPVFVSGGPHPGLDDGASSGYVINGGDPITGTIFASNHAPAGDGNTSTDQIMAVSMSTGTPGYRDSSGSGEHRRVVGHAAHHHSGWPAVGQRLPADHRRHRECRPAADGLRRWR